MPKPAVVVVMAIKRDSPVRIGAEIGYSYFGRFITDVSVNGYEGDFKTSYGIANLNGVFRIRPPVKHTLTPFLDFFCRGQLLSVVNY